MIKEEIKNIPESKKDLKKFGLTVGIALLVIAAVLFYKSNYTFYIWGAAGILLIATAIIYPLVLKPFNKIWMTIAVLLGWLSTRIILTTLFYTALPATAFAARIFGKKFLDLEIDKSRNTYWEKREKKHTQQKDYENQF